MADSYLERVAGEIADLAIADENASGDINIVDTIAKVLGSSSQTLEEAFLTAVRVRKAEERARKLLAERAASGFAQAKTPAPAPMQGSTPEDESIPEPDEVIAPPVQPAIAAPQVEETPDTPEYPANAVEAEQAARDKEVTEDAISRLKKAGIGMPRRITK